MDRVKLRRGLQVSQWIFPLDKELLEAISKLLIDVQTATRCVVTQFQFPDWLIKMTQTNLATNSQFLTPPHSPPQDLLWNIPVGVDNSAKNEQKKLWVIVKGGNLNLQPTSQSFIRNFVGIQLLSKGNLFEKNEENGASNLFTTRSTFIQILRKKSAIVWAFVAKSEV